MQVLVATCLLDVHPPFYRLRSRSVIGRHWFSSANQSAMAGFTASGLLCHFIWPTYWLQRFWPRKGKCIGLAERIRLQLG